MPCFFVSTIIYDRLFQINGGQLLARIQEHHYFSEPQAAEIVREIANALHFLHGKGVAHRDLKPENILCVHRDRLCPVKICDFDLGSGISFTSSLASPLATPQLMTPVSFFLLIILFLSTLMSLISYLGGLLHCVHLRFTKLFYPKELLLKYPLLDKPCIIISHF